MLSWRGPVFLLLLISSVESDSPSQRFSLISETSYTLPHTLQPESLSSDNMNRVLPRASLVHPAPSPILRHTSAKNLQRFFHPEPRSFQNSPHGTHRFIYRWTVQAIATPFAVAYLCEKIANRDDGDRGFTLSIPEIDAGLLTEPINMGTRVWGQMRGGS